MHPLHRAWRMLPQGARRAALGRAIAWLAPRPDTPPPPRSSGAVIAGEVRRASGIGQSARLTQGALQQAGVPSWWAEPGAPLPPEHAPLIVHGSASALPLELLRLGRRWVRGRRVIGYWPWELPVTPEAWRQGAGFAHEAWAPSRFAAAALEKLIGAVRVVPYPVATRPPAPSARDRDGFGLPSRAFVTLVRFNLASSFERKNPLGAIAAHRAAFGEDADRVLVLHVTNPHHFPADFARLAAQADAASNVRVITETMSRADSEALVACSDVVMSLHRSEGFGLVPAEAMMQGKPVVVTDWSATAEYIDSGCGALVPARLVPVRDARGVYALSGAVWAEPAVETAASWLQRLAADPALRDALGQAGQRAVMTRLGPEPLLAALAH